MFLGRKSKPTDRNTFKRNTQKAMKDPLDNAQLAIFHFSLKGCIGTNRSRQLNFPFASEGAANQVRLTPASAIALAMASTSEEWRKSLGWSNCLLAQPVSVIAWSQAGCWSQQLHARALQTHHCHYPPHQVRSPAIFKPWQQKFKRVDDFVYYFYNTGSWNEQNHRFKKVMS